MNKQSLLETRKELEELIIERTKEIKRLKRKKNSLDARIETYREDSNTNEPENSNVDPNDEEQEDDDDTADDESLLRASQDEPSTCMICMEEWTIGSEHRVCCLRCGHLFGRSCIERWIKDKGSAAKCPSCNKPAKKRDLINLWCKSISATDQTELIQTMEALEREKKLRKTDAAIIYTNQARNDMLHDEINKLKKELILLREQVSRRDEINKKLHNLIDRVQKGQKTDEDVDLTTIQGSIVDVDNLNFDMDVEFQEVKGSFHFQKRVETCQQKGCRSFTLCPTSAIILIAQPAPQNSRTLFGGFGLRKVSAIDTNSSQFIPLHSKMITSVQVKPVGDLVLTSSQDKKVILTSINNNTSILEYHCQYEPTCVAWSTHRDQQFYVASGNCFVTLYDMRNTSEYIYQTSKKVANTRILSIAATAGRDDLNGLLVNDARGSQFLEISGSSDYESNDIDRAKEHLTNHQLPFEGMMGTVDFNKKLDIALISTRRSAMSENCAHNLIQLQKTEDDTGRPKIECKTVSTYFGGREDLLSQSRLLKHPTLSESLLVGAVDDQSGGIKLWDTSDNKIYQRIRTQGFIRDMIMYNPENTNMHFLYTLDEKGLSIHEWSCA